MLIDRNLDSPTPVSSRDFETSPQARDSGNPLESYMKTEPYTKERIDSLVEISHVPGKGRCLFVRDEYNPGETIFIEEPLFSVVPSSNQQIWDILNELDKETPFAIPPLWHQAVLISIITGTEETHEILMNKWVIDPNQEVTQDVHRVLQAICSSNEENTYVYNDEITIDPKIYSYYLQVWPLNAFGRSADPDGLVIYDRISFTSHSCDATCCWYHTENDHFILRARKKLVPGDEITISYLGETDLLLPTHRRRELLGNWHFFCDCERCSQRVDVARGFLCKSCHYGSIFLNFDRRSRSFTSTGCKLCNYRLNDSEIVEYIDLETAYTHRIDAIDASDLFDITQVYDHAKNVFNQHWVLYKLQSLLYDAYKGRGNLQQAVVHLLELLHYADKVISGPLYIIAFMHEELADLLTKINNIDVNDSTNSNLDIGILNMIMASYFNSAALLALLCGYNHSYYYSIVTKRHTIEKLAVSVLKKLNNC